MSNELAKPAVPVSDSAALILAIQSAASNPDVDVEKMERLWAMREKMEARNAEIEFNDSMTRIQAQMGRISADATNPQTRSNYATYGALDRALRPIYTKEGMSLSFSTEDSPDGTVGMVCYVSHSAGHTRMYRAVVPSDGKGAKGNDVMTKTHAFGSGTSYGMRYLLKMIFNVAIGEDDDDGNDAGGEVNQQDAARAQRKVLHDAAYGMNSESIEFIKDRIKAGDYAAASAEWRALSMEDQRALWIAPSYGGCFTTEERQIMRDEFPKHNPRTQQ